MKENLVKKIYVISLFVIMAVPFLLFFVFPTQSTTENKKLSQMPEIINERGLNLNYLEDLSLYFEDRFAFRNYMVDINSQIRGRIFMTSPEDDVIIGRDGWLYYSSTLDDYLGDNLSNERTLFSIARNVALMQDYVKNRGAEFVFTICPNKNSIYPENMPIRYSATISNEKDAKRLEVYLNNENVNYVNLFELFENSTETLYLKGDSHWNKKGAVMGYNQLLNKASKEHEDYTGYEVDLVSGAAAGDLSQMIYPLHSNNEADYVYDRKYTYKYNYCDNEKITKSLEDVLAMDSETEDVTYSEIITSSDAGEGALLMYRDSFGNALIDLLSEEFERSYFTKLEPYDLSDMGYIGADVVIMEKVERHIQSLSKVAPLMIADSLSEESEAAFVFEALADNPDYPSDVDIHRENGLLVINGVIPEDAVETESRVFVLVSVDGTFSVYEAFLLNDREYTLYLDENPDDINVKVFVTKKDGMTILCDEDSSDKINADYDRKLEEIKQAEKLEKERLEAEEKKAWEEAERLKAEEEKRLKEEEEKRLEEEGLLLEQKEQKEKETVAKNNKQSGNGGKTIVSKTFYEDCGADTGYYEIVWSDGSVTYEDVF